MKVLIFQQNPMTTRRLRKYIAVNVHSTVENHLINVYNLGERL